METKWTPGPWVVERNKRTWGWVDVAGPSLAVGGPTQATDLTLADEVTRVAEARLIAAAPDLYAALEMAHLWLDFDGRFDMQVINAALAKARGEA